METIYIILPILFFGLIAICCFLPREKLDVNEQKLTLLEGSIDSEQASLEEAEEKSFKNPLKWDCVQQCKNTTNPGLKRVCIDVCLNKILKEDKPKPN